MPIFILIAIFIIIIYGPHLWVRQLMKKYSREQYFSGSGYDLAQLLLDKMKMNHVNIEATDQGDCYNPENKTIYLSREICGKNSLAAVVVAAHEVGHAIQDHTGYKPLHTRTRMIKSALKIERIGAGVLLAVPFITLITRIPAAGALMFFGGLSTIGIPIIIHLLTLPTEIDASFKRALPLLMSGKFIPLEDKPAARKILLACALTYVTRALVDLLNVFRWIRLLRV